MKKENKLNAYIVDNEVFILNDENTCIASSDPVKIGQLLDVKDDPKLQKTNFSVKNHDVVLLCQNRKFSPKELELAKSLTKVTLEQYLNLKAGPTGSLDQFVTEVIETPPTPENIALFEKEAESLGLNLEAERTAILVEIKDFAEKNLTFQVGSDLEREEIIRSWKQKIVTAIYGFFTLKTDIICAYVGNGLFVFYKELAGGRDRFIRNMKTAYASIFGSLIDPQKNNLTVGFSNFHRGVQGLHDSYHEALQALRLGKKLIQKTNQSYYYGDLGTMRILTEDNSEKKKTFAREILEPLDKKTLRKTLETFFNEDMDIKKTAAKLHVHPNTINYRLMKIAEYLELDPRIFKQAFELRIALLVDQIFT